jgi:hypothetical protein
VENRALHEGAAGLFGGVLIKRDDVGAGSGEERAHCGDQPRPVRASQQQPADILDRQVPRLRVRALHALQGVTRRTLRPAILPTYPVLRRARAGPEAFGPGR